MGVQEPKHIAPEIVTELEALVARIVHLPVYQYVYLCKLLNFELDTDDDA